MTNEDLFNTAQHIRQVAINLENSRVIPAILDSLKTAAKLLEEQAIKQEWTARHYEQREQSERAA